jgi:hypothetical protein
MKDMKKQAWIVPAQGRDFLHELHALHGEEIVELGAPVTI